MEQVNATGLSAAQLHEMHDDARAVSVRRQAKKNED